MITLQKCPDKDFVILNLTDPQLGDEEWEEGHQHREILTHTVTELINRVHPDLITVSGDLAWANHMAAYRSLADFLDSFQIPWAPVWGNHDYQDGPDFIDVLVDEYSRHPYCLYEKGDPALGNGNYILCIEEEGKLVEGIFMMDSHNVEFYTDAEGNTSKVWAKLFPEQLEWYRKEIENLKLRGCFDTTMILHIPIYAYREAFREAFSSDMVSDRVSLADSYNGMCWKEGYKDSFGVQYEGVSSYPEDEGAFDVITRLGSTKHILCGHDHVNNWVIRYKGVRLMYGTKTGPGCYWDARLNGGTVLRVTADGVAEVRHEIVDVSELL